MAIAEVVSSRVQVPNQTQLWNAKHLVRGGRINEGDTYMLRFTPNSSAVDFARCLPNRSVIMEIGSANGRDARFWALRGHLTFCSEISTVALDQMMVLAREQGVDSLVVPQLHDIRQGELPDIGSTTINGFYARSALHVSDTAMQRIASCINQIMVPGGIIMVEGKSPEDPKVQRSISIGSNLVTDPHENGHVRRVWTEEYMRELCDQFGWAPEEIKRTTEQWLHGQANFIRLLAIKT